MKFSFCYIVFILFSSVLFSCVGNKSDSGSSRAGSSDTSSVSHIVGSNPAPYNEQSDSGNGSKATGEATNYTLDSEGLIISGIFNAGSSLPDFYQFHTGNFERVSVQVFVDGQLISTSSTSEMFITLGSVDNYGFGNLLGGSYFTRAWVRQQTLYFLSITGSATSLHGKSYTIEVVGVP